LSQQDSPQADGSRAAEIPTESSPAVSTGRPEAPPLVSVIIPAYRCAEYIAQGVESVLAQSLNDFELIVVNDGSPDTSELEIALQPYRPQIQYLKQANGGPSAARNTGIRRARGKYVAFLDGDDYWAPNHLAKSVGLLEKSPGIVLVYCDCVLIKDGKPYNRVFLAQEQSSRVSFESLLLQSSTISTSCVVAVRQAILSVGGFDEGITRCEDFDLWLRVSFEGGRITYHPDPEVYHRMHDVSLSSDGLAMIKDRVRVYNKATTLPISREQRRIIRRMITKSESDGYTDQLKAALDREDYNAALASATRANEVERSWKLRMSILGLRTAPRLFRKLHMLRSSLLQRREYSPNALL